MCPPVKNVKFQALFFFFSDYKNYIFGLKNWISTQKKSKKILSISSIILI